MWGAEGQVRPLNYGASGCTRHQSRLSWAWNVSIFGVSSLTQTTRLLWQITNTHSHISPATAATPTLSSPQLISPRRWPLSTGQAWLSLICSCRLNRGRHSQSTDRRYTYSSGLLSEEKQQLSAPLHAVNHVLNNVPYFRKAGNINE